MEGAKKGIILGATRSSPSHNKTFAFPNNKQRLVRLYMQNRFLWDPSDARYKNKALKERALSNIGSSFGVSVAEVKAEIHILRTQFFREVRKIARRRNTDEFYVSKWCFFEELLPLQDTIVKSKKGGNLLDQSGEVEGASTSAYATDNGARNTSSSAVYLITSSAVDGQNDRTTESATNVAALRRKNVGRAAINQPAPRGAPARFTPTGEAAIVNSLDKLVEVSKKMVTQDYWQHFGNFVAADLRKKPPLLAEIQRNKICALLLGLAPRTQAPLPTYVANAPESHEAGFGTTDAENTVGNS